ncbi:MAG: hypothetical protein AAB733_03335 [Patescibacteria group bacterium]
MEKTILAARERVVLFQRIQQGCLFAIVALVPMIFFPADLDLYEMPKAVVLSVLASIGLVAWLAERALGWPLPFQWGTVDILLVLWIGVNGLSAIFSWDLYRSLVGWSGLYHEGLLVTVALAAMVLLFRSQATRQFRERILALWLCVSSAIVLVNLFQYFGISIGYRFTMVAESAVSVSAVVAISLILLVGVVPHVRHYSERGVVSLAIALHLFFLFVFDQGVGWAMLLPASLILAFGAVMARKSVMALIAPTVLSLVALLGLFVDVSALLGSPPVSDLGLTQRESSAILRSAFDARPFLGYGPHHAAYAIDLFRPDSLNQGVYWDLEFMKLSNGWFQMIVALGGVGAVLWFLVMLSAIRQSFQTLGSPREIPLLSATVGAMLILAFLFIPWNLALWWFTWFYLGMIGYSPRPTIRKRLKPNAGWSVACGAAVIVVLVYGWMIGVFVLAHGAFFQGRLELYKQQSLPDVVQSFRTAYQRFPFEPSFALSYAESLTTLAFVDIQQQGAYDAKRLEPIVVPAYNILEKALARKHLHPQDLLQAFEAYAQIEPVVVGSYESLSPRMEQAIQQYPRHPGLQLRLAQYHVQRALILEAEADQAKREDALLAAESILLRVIALRPSKENYLLVGLTEQELGKKEEARKNVEKAAALDPSDPFAQEVLDELNVDVPQESK